MANVNAPYGARVVGHRSGSPFNARIRPYVVSSGYGSAMYVGDFVVATGDGQVNQYGVNLSNIELATSSSTAILGVVVGFMPNPNNLYLTYKPASTLATAYICDDPDALFEIQANGTVSITANHFMSNAKMSVAAGSAYWGWSGTTLDSNTIVTTDDQLRIEGMSQRQNNEIGQYCNLIVSINDHLFNQKAGV